MRSAKTIRLASILCLALACSRSDEAAAPASPEPGGSASAGEAGAPSETTAFAVYAGHDYVCPDGKTFNARLEKGNALVTAEGSTLTLVPSANSLGARYEGEGVLYIARGEEAVLARAGSPPQICKAK